MLNTETHSGIESPQHARRVLARAMVALGRAENPGAMLKQLEDEIFEALKLLEFRHPAARALGFEGQPVH